MRALVPGYDRKYNRPRSSGALHGVVYLNARCQYYWHTIGNEVEMSLAQSLAQWRHLLLLPWVAPCMAKLHDRGAWHFIDSSRKSELSGPERIPPPDHPPAMETM